MEKIIPLAKCTCIVACLIALTLCNVAKAQNNDIDWLRSINSHRTAARDAVMINFTNSVYPFSAALPIGQLIYGYAKHDSQNVHYAWQTVEGLGLNFIITFGLKYAVSRPRPYNTYSGLNPYQRDADPSFPSGHTSFAFTTATALSLEYHKWYIIVPSYLWAGTVGFSRLYLGMHYPSDVLAGALIGTGSSWLSYKAQNWLNHKFAKKEKRDLTGSN